MATTKRRHSKMGSVLVGKMRTPQLHVVQRTFNKAQAQEIARNLDLDKLGIPVINVRDHIPWVLDGQHRIWALKDQGFEAYEIECEIYEGLSDPEMAEIFLSRDKRRAISTFDKFFIACTAGRERHVATRRAVESQGLKVSRHKDPRCVAAVAALLRVYDHAGEVVLGQALRALRDGYGGDASAFDGHVINGLGLVFNRFNGRVDEAHMSSALSKIQYGIRGLLRKAEAQQEKTGNQKAQCVAAAIVEFYNKDRHAKRLPHWWRGDASDDLPKHNTAKNPAR